MQPEFNRPEFLEGNSAEEIHERMMNNLPDDIDDMTIREHYYDTKNFREKH